MYYKKFKCPKFSFKSITKEKYSSNQKKKITIFYFRLYNKNLFNHKKENRNKYLNIFNLYVIKMMTN